MAAEVDGGFLWPCLKSLFFDSSSLKRRAKTSSTPTSARPKLASGGKVDYLGIVNDRISIEPEICNGRPVIKGTRIPAQTILEFLGAGDSIEDVLNEYPSLTREDVLACIQYSSRLMGNHFRLERVA